MAAQNERSSSSNAVCAVVVTHNRPKLLQRCLDALAAQSARCDVVVVDNASAEETRRLLDAWSEADPAHRLALRSDVNIGGAGGFSLGVKTALERLSVQRLWLMDDDAFAPPHALQSLLDAVDTDDCGYSSVAVGSGEGERSNLVWHASLQGSGGARTRLEDLGQIDEVSSLPFLGFLVSRPIVERIGPPDESFFLCADDVEYSARIRKNGGRLLLVRDSVIFHPLPKRRQIAIFGKRIDFRYQSVMKSYYEVRNKIRVARRYWPLELWSKTVPGLVIRLVLSLALEAERRARVGAFLLGCWDGFRDVGGRRKGF